MRVYREQWARGGVTGTLHIRRVSGVVPLCLPVRPPCYNCPLLFDRNAGTRSLPSQGGRGI